MGQEWTIVCIDEEESVYGGKLGEFFNDRCTNAGVEDLIRPPRALPQIPRIPNGTGVSKSWTTESKLLAKLPQEIFHLIAADVAKFFEDLVSFASACHLFWDICRPRIENYLKGKTWAGSRIICTDNWTRSNADLPPGVLSDEEKASMMAEYADRIRYDEYSSSLYLFAEKNFRRPFHIRSYVDCLKYACLPGAVNAALDCMVPIDYKSAGKPAILRNLSKKSFVRSQAVDALNRVLVPDSKANKRGFCLGDALTSRICWSGSSYATHGPEDLPRGLWAGDRFDVILAEEFEMQNDHAEWKDVSEEVCDKLGECWED